MLLRGCTRNITARAHPWCCWRPAILRPPAAENGCAPVARCPPNRPLMPPCCTPRCIAWMQKAWSGLPLNARLMRPNGPACATVSNARRVHNRTRIVGVAGIQRARRLEQQHMHLLAGYRPVLHTARHNQKLTLVNLEGAIFAALPVIHPETAVNHQE